MVLKTDLLTFNFLQLFRRFLGFRIFFPWPEVVLFAPSYSSKTCTASGPTPLARLLRLAGAQSKSMEASSTSICSPQIGLQRALDCAGTLMAASVKQLTLVMLHSGQRILLGMKKRGFGEGKINVRAPLSSWHLLILNFSPGVWGKS